MAFTLPLNNETTGNMLHEELKFMMKIINKSPCRCLHEKNGDVNRILDEICQDVRLKTVT